MKLQRAHTPFYTMMVLPSVFPFTKWHTYILLSLVFWSVRLGSMEAEFLSCCLLNPSTNRAGSWQAFI